MQTLSGICADTSINMLRNTNDSLHSGITLKSNVEQYRRMSTFGLGGGGGGSDFTAQKNCKMPESISCTYVLKSQ